MARDISEELEALVAAALPHVAFDGWSEGTFRAALADRGLSAAEGRRIAPRGAVDLAVGYHRLGDRAMAAAMAAEDQSEMRYRDRVARAIWLRLEASPDREVVRRGTALFALPHLAPLGASLIWGTADAIWEALGDTSRDINWYSKRATLSAVYGSVVLYWLGDESEGAARTREFIDRRIEDVMRFEQVKARVRESAAYRPFAGPLGRLFGAVRPPASRPPRDLPGQMGQN